MYLRILLFATIILFFFRALNFFTNLLPLTKKAKHRIGYILPAVEFVSWIGFAIWSINFIYRAEAFYILVVLGLIIVILMIPTWFFAKDFLYGMYLKIQNKIEVDSKIKTTEFEGTIVKTDYYTFDIISTNGNIKTVPYNKIRSEIFTKKSTNNNLIKQRLTLTFPNPEEEQLFLDNLKKSIINTPWVASSLEPIIDNFRYENDKMIVEIIVWVLDLKHAKKVKEWLYHSCKTS